MQKDYKNNDIEAVYDEVNMLEIIHILINGKWIIVSLTIFASVIGIIYSLSLPNIYTSKALLAPVGHNSISSSLQSYSSLAGLAGINLSSGPQESNTNQALEKIKSLSFFKDSILDNIFLPDLMAIDSWDFKTNKLIYDKEIYDIKNDSWIRDFNYPQKQVPSAQESFNTFKNKHLTVSVDKKSGFISISIKHQSPFIAKQWVELVVNEVNNFYREKDKNNFN